MLKKILPSTYQKISKLGKRKVIAIISISCLIAWFELIFILSNSLQNLNYVILASVIGYIFFFIIFLFIKFSEIGNNLINDISNFPLYVHYLIISLTLILFIIVITKIHNFYGRSNSESIQ